jgi:glycosyltransferase involved in cell wall biosynthesis
MIVKNEAARLGACLASAEGAVDEIVVVDTGSTDPTIDLAKAAGAHVSTFDFGRPDFAGARNQSIERARGAWILVLDGDEILTPAAPAVVRALTGREERVGYVVQRRNVRPGAADPLVDYAVRLFPNRPGIRYRGRVHETIDGAILACGGSLRTSAVTIDHLLPREDGRSVEKSLFYLRILDEELAEDPDNVERLAFRRAELHKLGRLDEAADVAERIAVLAPEDASNHVDVGLYRLVHRRDAAGAERAFRRAIAIDPRNERALGHLRAMSTFTPTN